MRVFAGLLLTLFWALLWAAAALAQERITFYDVDIAVEPSGDIEVVETIELVSEGVEIRRGIFRELPAAYTFMGVRRPYEYELLEVLRDGQAEPVATIRQGNAVTWRIGRADRLLDPGPHRYTIRYRVADQIRRHRDRGDAFGDRDELWFNAVGTYWDFPIERARATVRFQDGAEVVDATVVTGNRRDERRDASVTVRGDTVVAETTRPLPARNGLNLSVSVAPGTIAALSAERRARLFWLRHGAVILLGLGGLALLLFYWRAWSRVGRDPARLPVFARYEPPLAKDGAPYSPAAVHYLHHKGFREMDALSSLLMQLGAQGVLDIEADKKRTTLRQVAPTPDAHDARILLGSILPNGGTRVLDGGTDTGFHLGVMNFHRLIAERYGPKYYRRNLLWAVGGVLLSAALAGIVLLSPVAKNSPLVLGLFGALALLNIVFAILLPAPTKRGAQVSSEIEGFKLYLETAEEDRLNMADPVSDHYQGRSPAMTVALYERFLPYAMALGVEKPWTKQFEDSLPREAAEYRPSYARGSALSGRRGPVGFSRALGKTLTAGVAAAAPVSQSSGSGF
ncbi:MAG: DUF2207 domain-containing protein, partial [Pseudomonadota bacterium]